MRIDYAANVALAIVATVMFSATASANGAAFILQNLVTGSKLYTNTNKVEVVGFSPFGGYDLYQISQVSEAENLSDAWLPVGEPPSIATFAVPDPEGVVTLRAWFADSTEILPTTNIAATITYVRRDADVNAVAVATRSAVTWGAQWPAKVWLNYIDAGSSSSIGIYNRSLAVNPDDDITPDNPTLLTLATAGVYTVTLTVIDMAGNSATDTTTLTVYAAPVPQETTWTGGGDGSNWKDDANWDNFAPGPGAFATIVAGADVALAETTAEMASLTMSGGKITSSGWNTAIRATNIVVGGTITHVVNSDITGALGVYEDWTPDARVLIECDSLTINQGGTINANGKGYKGGIASQTRGFGPGGGPYTVSSSSQGAGHGGQGGTGRDGKGGVTYGSPYEPIDPGSGGGQGYQVGGGNGGGAVRVCASGAVVVDGSISANGAASGNDHCGGGSGGSIWITCKTMAGSGVISANGGKLSSDRNTGSAGGGGRIAVAYDSATQAFLSPQGLLFTTSPGYGDPNGTQYVAQLPDRKGGIGSLFLTDGQLLTEALADSVRDTRIYGVKTWNPARIIASNTVIEFVESDCALSSPESVAVIGADLVPYGANNSLSLKSILDFNPATIVVTGALEVVAANITYRGGGYTQDVGRVTLVATNHADFSGGGMRIHNGCEFRLGAATATIGGSLEIEDAKTTCHLLARGATNAVGGYCAMLAEINGPVIVRTNATLMLWSDPDTGGAPLVRAHRLTVAPGGKVSALGTGFPGGRGQTAPAADGKGFAGGKIGYDTGSGGAHGGQGGTGRYGNRHQPNIYDDQSNPVLPGSGGGAGYSRYIGGAGGGVVRVEVRGRIEVDGLITARGQDEQGGYSDGHAGGGAGGSINLRCSTFAGAAGGELNADGGDTGFQGGAGGGGRVAVWRTYHTFAGSATANAGKKGYNQAGKMAADGTVFWGFIPAAGTVLLLQ